MSRRSRHAVYGRRTPQAQYADDGSASGRSWIPGRRAAPDAATLVFEQPLNERMRTFLRLDFLYNQALYHNEMASQWGSRAAMASLIDILAITTRGDVRSDVLKELERQLTQPERVPDEPWRRLAAAQDPDGQPGASAHGPDERRVRLPAAAARLGVPERHQAPQRHSGRHLRVRSARLLLLAEPVGRGANAHLQPMARPAASAVRCDRGTAVAHAPERPQRARRSPRAAPSTSPSIATIPLQLLRISLPASVPACIRKSAAAIIAAACVS